MRVETPGTASKVVKERKHLGKKKHDESVCRRKERPWKILKIQNNTLEGNETTETNQKQRTEKLDTNKDRSANERNDSKADL